MIPVLRCKKSKSTSTLIMEFLDIGPRPVLYLIQAKDAMSDITISVEADGTNHARILHVLDLYAHRLTRHWLPSRNQAFDGCDQHHRRVVCLGCVWIQILDGVARVKVADELGGR